MSPREEPASRPGSPERTAPAHPGAASSRQSEHFRDLVEHVSDVIGIIDPTGTVLYASPGVKRLLDLAPEEIVGHNVFEFAHPEDAPAVGLAIEESMTSEQPQPVIVSRARHRDGSWRWLESGGKGATDEDGARIVIITARDITEQKR